ncbi:DUF3263 domain-containing protein [Micromonospora sp. WMMD980]|uniref:DUF3263 domain-containing protein n=1 Tax=Micromonospora sp. WMMD980 TaxID=3016088 RepID=UPI00241596C6|nr:DUF3263 domain-containing protein [Micromonospora sp. WMMD980]MDG4804383.1 DUF3263 domain-containing protein [Micromonospora sp. WMMD980]
MSADATDRAAVDESATTRGTRRGAGVPVPPPRPAPPVESAPAVEAEPPSTAEAAALAEPATVADEAEEARLDTDEPRPAADAGPAGGLTERERRILDFESQWWKHAGAKEQAVRDTFGLSATRYYQLLNALLDHPAALAAEPLLIGRLRRLRSSRARNRRR